MSVIVKGMEMPKNCAVCRLEKDLFGRAVCFGYEDGRALNKDDLPPVGNEERRPLWCPLVPVPPHGRLIDADALEKYMYEYKKPYLAPDSANKSERGAFFAWIVFWDAVRKAETIIPAEGVEL